MLTIRSQIPRYIYLIAMVAPTLSPKNIQLPIRASSWVFKISIHRNCKLLSILKQPIYRFCLSIRTNFQDGFFFNSNTFCITTRWSYFCSEWIPPYPHHHSLDPLLGSSRSPPLITSPYVPVLPPSSMYHPT